MSAEKLSSDEVPQKFVEWLITMGYPVEKVPSVDKVAQKCRGQYYMVWRSMMEHVHPKDEIREKRLKVFCDDVKLCQKNNVFNERGSNVVVPEQLQLWRQHEELQRKVANAEAKVTQARQNLNQLMDKVSSKICQRDLSRKRVEDKQRRVWLLRQLCADLELKKTNLEETRDIANSLCTVNDDDDLQVKVEKCVSLLRRSSPAPRPAASSSLVSTHGDDTEEQLSSLVRARGDTLWARLAERRTSLHVELAQANMLHTALQDSKDRRCTTQAVLARTASLHCSLGVEAMKNRAHIKHTRDRIAAYIDDFSDYITGAACELLVLRCERASAESRVRSQRSLLDELITNSGVFEIAREQSAPVNGGQITAVDKTIESSRDELKRLIVSLAATERKVVSIKDTLTAVFNSFHSDTPIDRYRGVQLNLPQESIAAICRFYEEQRHKENKAELSLDFDTPECSFNNTFDYSNPKFVNELNFYLKKFNLEKNRKLIMESGEKVWIFETIQSSLERLYSKWLSNDTTPLLCPSANLAKNIDRFITHKNTRNVLENIIKHLNCYSKYRLDLDIESKKEQEVAAIDKIKKQIGENLQNLQKSAKTLELGQKNLHLWQDDTIKKSISNNRTVDGKTYRDYEAFYIELLTLNA
ncbi:uncharacterized protein dgt5 [Epargyreus clarus]|uniref:uncharacterized protein dgt5 n=1 Tax=Epargyreus clarus TaxID=520877 RepID=UPI003C2E3E90